MTGSTDFLFTHSEVRQAEGLLPKGLWPGPDDTAFGKFDDVPEGWEYRHRTDTPWFRDGRQHPPFHGDAIMQCRQIRLPDPHHLKTWVEGGYLHFVVTISEMRKRDDLHRWETARHDGGVCGWKQLRFWGWPDRHEDTIPIIVRRKAT